MKLTTLQNNNSSNFQEDEIEIQAGQYWITKKDTQLAKKDTLLLVLSLNIIDEYLHSVIVAGHPTSNYTSDEFMLNDFLDTFSFVPLEEAEKIRQSEIDEVNNKIELYKEELKIGYKNKDDVEVATLLSHIASHSDEKANLPVSASKDVDTIKEQAKNLKIMAQEQAKFINNKTTLISSASMELSNYYVEKGKQSLASVDDTLKFVTKLQKGIHTLNIFTGKGVTVTKLASGKEADNDEPLTFNQRKLFLDEELFYEFHLGGADFDSIDEFSKYLQKDFSIIEDLIPTPRGVVLMQYRRYSKEYFTKDQIIRSWTLLQDQAEMNKLNETRFLLVRNGENIYKIDSEDLRSGVRLFPTSVELNSYFKKGTNKFNGVHDVNDKIMPTELEYVKARELHDSKAIYYKRVLIMLSGLHTREPEIFGNFLESDKYTNAWYSPKFQSECCKFIHDEEEGLDWNQKSFKDFLRDKNSYLQSGSRVLCKYLEVMNVETSPMAVKVKTKDWYRGDEEYEHILYTPIEEIGVKIAFAKAGDICISVPCENKNAYNKYDGYHTKKANVNINLSKVSGGGFIVLDGIKKEEIKQYLKSRKAREDYNSFGHLLIEAMNILEKEEIDQKPFIDTFKTALISQYGEIEKIDDLIEESILIYRANKKGINIPNNSSSTKEYLEALKSIGLIAYSIIKRKEIVKNILDNIGNYTKDEVARISVNSKNSYFLYTISDKENQLAIYQNFSGNYAELNKFKITVMKKGIKVEDQGKVYNKYYIDEKILLENIKPFSKTTDYCNHKDRHDIDIHHCEVNENMYKAINYFNSGLFGSNKIINTILSGEKLNLAILKPFADKIISKNKRVTYYKKTYHFYLPVALIGIDTQQDIKFIDITRYYSKEVVLADISFSSLENFITIYGDDESFEYLFDGLSNIRFGNIAREYRDLRSSKCNLEASLGLTVCSNSAFKEIYKPRNGIFLDNWYCESYKTFNIKLNRDEKYISINDIIKKIKQKCKKFDKIEVSLISSIRNINEVILNSSFK